MPQKDPCQKQACEIQKCLQANNYMESKCQAVVQELRKCCARYAKGRSLVCSGFEKEEEDKRPLKRTATSTSADKSDAAPSSQRAALSSRFFGPGRGN
ncbi:cx9C motif-containing protein 4 [Suricata suricatta]|uniref:Cx9C motif-containing protein 4 n=1 Tax=Suricata suricatta TaxID=37032 RepID=A0A673UFJ4_SURSU|nr:cx9C motif-containing protein 4 [Suricata suricatta]XP_029786484.1 cx9C motif-containing protein 4 [Suricata suricatta]XP_029786486.1 cx9C motif-containing protein 4 [Suricata suricatta]